MDDSEARAFAMRVLEHPGGPYSRTPEGGRAPRAAKALLYLSSNTFETFEGEGARTIRRIETRNKARDMARQANAKAERASRKISERTNTRRGGGRWSPQTTITSNESPSLQDLKRKLDAARNWVCQGH